MAADFQIDGGQVTVSGGQIEAFIGISGYGSITMYGYDFAIDGFSVGTGIRTLEAFPDGSLRQWTLTGTLMNEGTLNNELYIRDDAQLFLIGIPEPATLLLLGLGGLAIRRRH